MRRFLTILVALFLVQVAGAQTKPSQQSMLGRLQLGMEDRNQFIGAQNSLAANIDNWNTTNGGPRLSNIGIQLKPLMDRNSLLAWMLSGVMVMLVGVAILRGMHNQEDLGKLMSEMGFKMMVGILFLHFPAVVYGIGMVLRDAGVTIMTSAYSLVPSAQSAIGGNKVVSASPTNLDFEHIRVGAMRRALQDNQAPIIGTGSNITYDLYDQLVQLTTSYTGDQINFSPILGAASELEKTRLLNNRLPLLLEALSRMPASQQTIQWTAKRVGIDGLPEKLVAGSGGTFDTTTAAGTTQFQTQNIPASRATVISSSLSHWLEAAEQIRSGYQTKADAAGFTTADEQATAEELAKQGYDSMVYTRTSAFIRQTFWNSSGFACGVYGGKDWQYISNFSKDDQAALDKRVQNLETWFAMSTGRVGASFTPSQPADQGTYVVSKTFVSFLAKIRDWVIVKFGFWFFDIVIESYVFLLWLTFPLWFYEKTARSFTGALNTFIVACITPAALTFVFLVWDMFMTQIMHLMTGGVLDLAYASPTVGSVIGATILLATAPLYGTFVIIYCCIYLAGCIVFLWQSPKFVKNLFNGTSVISTAVGGALTGIAAGVLGPLAAASATGMLGGGALASAAKLLTGAGPAAAGANPLAVGAMQTAGAVAAGSPGADRPRRAAAELTTSNAPTAGGTRSGGPVTAALGGQSGPPSSRRAQRESATATAAGSRGAPPSASAPEAAAGDGTPPMSLTEGADTGAAKPVSEAARRSYNPVTHMANGASLAISKIPHKYRKPLQGALVSAAKGGTEMVKHLAMAAGSGGSLGNYVQMHLALNRKHPVRAGDPSADADVPEIFWKR